MSAQSSEPAKRNEGKEEGEKRRDPQESGPIVYPDSENLGEEADKSQYYCGEQLETINRPSIDVGSRVANTNRDMFSFFFFFSFRRVNADFISSRFHSQLLEKLNPTQRKGDRQLLDFLLQKKIDVKKKMELSFVHFVTPTLGSEFHILGLSERSFGLKLSGFEVHE